ncbi:hypothetical protein WUBG_08301 [Wuchereria bancrofti]|uniref:Uncharacterized protein n=1 Tax=Wuchereria bancrofti TaxID=6293 RepID=J9EUI5_WUCBA|nr:hypothetical protein WUBG_08301 [Wuchereria bancrofti]VDM08693.1 unnamed protein product [Wuchereria bancrofti]
MPIVGERSKFSCLKIYDDTSSSSDGDNSTKLMGKMTPSQNKKHGNQKKSATCKSSSGFIVHSIPQKRKNKGKKTKKMPIVMEDGFIVQDGDGDYMEKKYHEDLQQAMENSREMASTASADPVQEIASSDVHAESWMEQETLRTKDADEVLISEIDLQASALFTKNDGPQKAKEQHLVALYRSKLVETLRQVVLDKEVKLKTESELTKYKSRYKKLCELLKDAEGMFYIFILAASSITFFNSEFQLNEKTHMAADLEKARTVEKELSCQIGELRGELMQARSKIRELELKYKELVSKQQH